MGRLFRFLNVTIAFTLLASLFVGVAPVMAQPGQAKPSVVQNDNANAPFVPGEVLWDFLRPSFSRASMPRPPLLPKWLARKL